MKILAIDTSGIVASVSLSKDEKVLAEININYKQNHSITLMPIIDNIFNMLDMDIKEIDYIACSCGPGSFTGLRIGGATTKAIAHSLNKKIVPISTLDMLAYNLFSSSKYIVPIIDARGGRVFTAIYKFEGKKLQKVLEERSIHLLELLKYIKDNNFNPIFLGDASISYKNEILNFDKNYTLAPISHNMQKSINLLSIAKEYIELGKTVDYNNFYIDYLRKPQAERELLEREKDERNF